MAEYLCVNNVMCPCFQPGDENRTIPINCGYIEPHDYELEPADREFMIMVREKPQGD